MGDAPSGGRQLDVTKVQVSLVQSTAAAADGATHSEYEDVYNN